MALRFNVPPNWPAPPEGWVPQQGWQPDPAWGPAPEGWNFWVEDDPAPAPATEPSAPEATPNNEVAEATVAEPARGEAVTETAEVVETASVAEPLETSGEYVPGSFSAQPAGEDQTRLIDYSAQQQESTETVAPATSADFSHETAEAPVADTLAGAGAAEAAGASSYNLNGTNYQSADAAYQAETSAQASDSYQPGQFQNQVQNPYTTQASQANPYAEQAQAANPYAAQAQQANPYAPQTDPTKKKNFFATTGGILTIIGIVLLVLIVGAVVAISMFFNAVKNSAESSSSYSYSSSSDSSSSDTDTDTDTDSSSSGLMPSYETLEGSMNGSVLEFSGEGDKIIDVSKRSNADQPAWVEFEYTPENGGYNSIYLRGYDSGKESSELFSIIGKQEGSGSKGSLWLDAQSQDTFDATNYIAVEGEGKWSIKVHPASDAPTYGKGETVKGDSPTAFVYKGGEAKLKVKFTSPKDNPQDFSLQGYEAKYEFFSTLINGEGSEYEGSKNINYTDSTPMSMENNFGGSWEITFE